jgi:hypothetical protein
MAKPTLAALAALLCLPAGTASAQSLEAQSFSRWRIQDKCVADSVKFNPDRDVASQVKRDAYVDKCMKDHGLEPRVHVAPPAEDSSPSPPAPEPH